MAKNKPDNPKQIYAPIPARAIGDQKLTALDFRVLAALAAHDRLGANGVGCYASHKRLASLVGCHVKSLSRSLATLAGGDGGAQYIRIAQHPLNARLRVYRVIYTEFDGAYLKGGIGNEPATDEAVTGNEPATDGPAIGNGNTTDKGGIGNQITPPLVTDIETDHVKNQAVTDVNIFNTSRETVFNTSREAGSGKEDASVSAMLSIIEQAVRSGANRRKEHNSQYLRRLLSGEVQAGTDNKARAARILQEIEAAA